MIENRTPNVAVTALVDGHPSPSCARATRSRSASREERSLLATLPERTFFRRYRETFTT